MCAASSQFFRQGRANPGTRAGDQRPLSTPGAVRHDGNVAPGLKSVQGMVEVDATAEGPARGCSNLAKLSDFTAIPTNRRPGPGPAPPHEHQTLAAETAQAVWPVQIAGLPCCWRRYVDGGPDRDLRHPGTAEPIHIQPSVAGASPLSVAPRRCCQDCRG